MAVSETNLERIFFSDFFIRFFYEITTHKSQVPRFTGTVSPLILGIMVNKKGRKEGKE